MKKFLKLKAALLSIAMLVASVPGVYAEGSTAVSATDGYFWLEAEDCIDKHVCWVSALSDNTVPDVVSGSGWGISHNQYPGADGYYIDFKINVEEAVSYDIYVYGGSVENTQWISAGKIKLNGTDLAAQPVHYSRNDWAKMGASAAINLGWSKATVAIAEGEQVLRYYIDDVILGSDNVLTEDDTAYQGALDLICVVPSDYGWTPSGTGKTSAKPVAPVPPTVFDFTNGYLWAEGENASVKNELSEKADNALSNSSSCAATKNTLPADGYYADFIINVPADDNYVVYFRGTYDDGTNGGQWSSNPILKVDGAEKTSQANGTANWFGGSGYYGGWRNSEAVSLTAGKHTVRWGFNSSRRGKNYDGHYVGLIDAICIIPADWEWTPSTSVMPVAPTYLDFTNGYLWAEGEAAKLNGISELSDATLSNSKGAAATVATLPTDGFYADFYVNVPEDNEYVVYFRGTYDDGSGNGQWSSNPILKVDGVEKTSQANGTANWFGGSGYYGGWRESETVSLTAGKHKIRWGFNEIRRGGTYYVGLIDAICIAPAEWKWVPDIATRPEEPVFNTYVWLEETNASFVHGGFASFQTPGDNFYGGNAKYISTPTAPSSEGYNIDFEVNMVEGEYDIYFRSTCENEWMSEPSLEVNGGEPLATTLIVNEQYTVKDNYSIGWKKATASMVQGENIIRWTLKDSRTASTETWLGAFDTMVIVPKGAKFTPVKLNVTEGDTTDELVQTKTDYELAIAMMGLDLENVKSDLALPTATQSGSAISWTTSDASVIAADGTVTRSTVSDKTVTLTATCDGYQKAFAATVKMIKEYDIDSFTVSGTIAAGNKISASADVAYNLSGSKEVMLIIALYSKDGKLLAVDLDKQNATSAGIDLSAELTVPNDADLTDAYAKGYLWNGIGDLKPIADSIDL